MKHQNSTQLQSASVLWHLILLAIHLKLCWLFCINKVGEIWLVRAWECRLLNLEGNVSIAFYWMRYEWEEDVEERERETREREGREREIREIEWERKRKRKTEEEAIKIAHFRQHIPTRMPVRIYLFQSAINKSPFALHCTWISPMIYDCVFIVITNPKKIHSNGNELTGCAMMRRVSPTLHRHD